MWLVLEFASPAFPVENLSVVPGNIGVELRPQLFQRAANKFVHVLWAAWLAMLQWFNWDMFTWKAWLASIYFFVGTLPSLCSIYLGHVGGSVCVVLCAWILSVANCEQNCVNRQDTLDVASNACTCKTHRILHVLSRARIDHQSYGLPIHLITSSLSSLHCGVVENLFTRTCIFKVLVCKEI